MTTRWLWMWPPLLMLWACGKGIVPSAPPDALPTAPDVGSPDSGASRGGTTGTGGTQRETGGAGGTGGGTATGSGGSSQPLPNVLVLLTDDQRYNTVHALGNSAIKTPNMDRLAQAGTSFTQASCQGGVHGALCVTSRVALMTGRTLNHLNGGGDVLPPEFTTIPELLRQAGYATFATGKWHSDKASYARMFDDADSIFFGGMHFPDEGGHEHPWLWHFDPTGKYPDDAKFQAGQFSSVMYADAAIALIKEHARPDRPFFGYVAFTAPHDPRTPPAPFDTMYDPAQIALPDNFLPEHPFDNGELHTRDEDLLPIPRDPDALRKEIAAYYGMISEVDSQIGRILDTLIELGLRDKTLVVFAGDNGLALGSHGLIGKQDLYEESIRVPLIMMGPGIAANTIDTRYAYLSDILPTLASLLGLAAPASCEGGALLGQATARPRANGYFQYRDLHRALRSADQWKLIGYRLHGTGTEFTDRVQLYNLALDPFEVYDLSALPTYQDKLAELQDILADERIANDDPLAK